MLSDRKRVGREGRPSFLFHQIRAGRPCHSVLRQIRARRPAHTISIFTKQPSRLPDLHDLRVILPFPLIYLLSTAKISTVHYARKDAKTTNSGSVGAKKGGRRRTSITGCIQAGYQGSVEAHAQSRSESVKALPAAHRPVAWRNRINRAHLPVISCQF
jgi:hypothetical protein